MLNKVLEEIKRLTDLNEQLNSYTFDCCYDEELIKQTEKEIAENYARIDALARLMFHILNTKHTPEEETVISEEETYEFKSELGSRTLGK